MRVLALPDPGDDGICDIERSEITIDEDVEDPAFTLLHELGHYVDYLALGTPTAPASDSAWLDQWRQAVGATVAVGAIENRYTNPVAYVNGEPVAVAEDRDTDYYLRRDELFARSFAQFIATNGGNPTIQAELDAAPSLAFAPGILYASQWEAVDFRPVEQALRNIFERMGWSRLKV